MRISDWSSDVCSSDLIKGVIRARRRAVDFMQENPDEAGDIIAKAYNLEPEVARNAVRNLVAARTSGIEYWGSGQIHLDGLARALEVQKMGGAIPGDIDAASNVDPHDRNGGVDGTSVSGR